MHLDKVWVEGNLGKTGQYVKFGDFQPWTMNGFINDANVKGASMEHWGKNFATHIFGGRMDVKDWDMAVNGSDAYDWEDTADGGHVGYLRANNFGDFVRGTKEKMLIKILIGAQISPRVRGDQIIISNFALSNASQSLTDSRLTA